MRQTVCLLLDCAAAAEAITVKRRDDKAETLAFPANTPLRGQRCLGYLRTGLPGGGMWQNVPLNAAQHSHSTCSPANAPGNRPLSVLQRAQPLPQRTRRLKLAGARPPGTINLPLRLRASPSLIGPSRRTPANRKWVSASTLYRSAKRTQPASQLQSPAKAPLWHYLTFETGSSSYLFGTLRLLNLSSSPPTCQYPFFSFLQKHHLVYLWPGAFFLVALFREKATAK